MGSYVLRAPSHGDVHIAEDDLIRTKRTDLNDHRHLCPSPDAGVRLPDRCPVKTTVLAAVKPS